MERKDKRIKIEHAICESVGEIGSVHELGWVVAQTYALLGAEFFDGVRPDQRPYLENGRFGHSPQAEIVSAVYSLIEWSVLDMTSDRRLRVVKKSKEVPKTK